MSEISAADVLRGQQELTQTYKDMSKVFLNAKGEIDTTVAKKMAEMDESIAKQGVRVQEFIDSGESNLRYLHPYNVDLTGDEFADDLFYPVRLKLNAEKSNRFEIFKTYSSGNRDATQPAGLNLIIEASGGTWGGNPMIFNIIQNYQTYRRTVAAIGFMSHGYELGVYLKGGCKYNLISSNSNNAPIIVSEHLANYTHQASDSPNKIDCGPVDVETAVTSNGAIATSSAFIRSVAYVQSLGGNNPTNYQ